MVTGQRFHGLEEADEVGALHGQQLLESRAAILLVVGQNHGAHVLDAIFGKEHVLGAAEADALGAEQAMPAWRRAECRRWRGP